MTTAGTGVPSVRPRVHGGLRLVAVAAVAVASMSHAGRSDAKGYAVGYGTTPVDPRVDPWIEVTDATVRPLLTPTQRREHRTHRVTIDYDADGLPDQAVMVRNRSQMGVLVTLGRSGRSILAYRAQGQWSDQGLRRIGTRSIGIEFPESNLVVLSSESGRPMVYFSDLDEH